MNACTSEAWKIQLELICRPKIILIGNVPD